MPINTRISDQIADWQAKMAAFSARLRETRETRGMTRKELAQRLGVAPGTIWNWENSYSYPKPGSVAQLASVLSVTEEFLRKGEDANGSGLSDNEAALDDDDAEPFPTLIEDFRQKVALATGMPPSRVRVSVEFLSN